MKFLKYVVLVALVISASGFAACGGNDADVNPVPIDVGNDDKADAGDAGKRGADAGQTCVGPLGNDTSDADCNNDPYWGGAISYHGGPVMTNPVKVYYVWYGDWKGNSATVILKHLARNIGKSDWFSINTDYYQQTSIIPIPGDGGDAGGSDAGTITAYATDQISLAKSIDVGYPHGANLSDKDIVTIITEAIDNKLLPLDPNGAYFVLTSVDVDQNISGWWTFCNSFCGWHDHTVINGVDIKLSFVGDSNKCPSSCTMRDDSFEANISVSPNGNWGADGMASVIAHELSEMVTDPDVGGNSAWHDDMGAENADKCAWTFGKSYCSANGAKANVHIDGRDYLLQQNWVIKDNCGHCALKRE